MSNRNRYGGRGPRGPSNRPDWRAVLAKLSERERAEALQVASEPGYPVCPGWHRCDGPAAVAVRAKSFGTAKETPDGFPLCPCRPGRWSPGALREHSADVSAHAALAKVVLPAEGQVPPRELVAGGLAERLLLASYRGVGPPDERPMSPQELDDFRRLEEFRQQVAALSDEQLLSVIRRRHRDAGDIL